MPSDSGLNRARVKEILLALRQRISIGMPLDLTRVLIVATADDNDVEHHGAARDILIAPADEVPQPAAYEGGGRYVDHQIRRFDVTLRTRLQLDTSQEDRDRLLDDTLGHFVAEDRLTDILENWHLLDPDDKPLATPIVVRGVGRPKRDNRDRAWVSSRLTIEIQYLRDLTLYEVV